jgi:hypothetical protein
MRRVIGITVGLIFLAGLAVSAPQIARAYVGGGDCPVPGDAPVTVLEPVAGEEIILFQRPDFRVSWTCYTNALWYQVRIYRPPDPETGAERFVEFRYNPDADDDWRRDQPSLIVATGLLDLFAEHTVVVTPMGPSEKMLAEYTGDYMPTGLPMEYYVPLAEPSEPVTFRVVR